MIRSDGRRPDQLRTVTIEPGYLKYAEGSALISVGNTRVLCAASIEDRVPQWLKGKGLGWVSAEYAMLPRATQERTQREAAKGRVGGRTHEIQRIIGRALRAVTDTTKLGERTVWIDCDVLQADGGTRTASVTGAYVALALALRRVVEPDGGRWPLSGMIAATSVGIVHGEPRCCAHSGRLKRHSATAARAMRSVRRTCVKRSGISPDSNARRARICATWTAGSKS
jgi:ribonuclease PH